METHIFKKACLKSIVFICVLKKEREWHVLISGGSEFQRCGAAKENVLNPYVLRLYDFLTRALEEDDLREREGM